MIIPGSVLRVEHSNPSVIVLPTESTPEYQPSRDSQDSQDSFDDLQPFKEGLLLQAMFVWISLPGTTVSGTISCKGTEVHPKKHAIQEIPQLAHSPMSLREASGLLSMFLFRDPSDWLWSMP